MCAVSELFDRIVDKNLLVRRMYVVANHVLPEADAPNKNDGAVQLDLFTDYAAEEEKQKAEDAALGRTKGSMSSMQLRLIEESKIHCAREHFKAISSGNVVYDVVDSCQSLLEKVMK